MTAKPAMLRRPVLRGNSRENAWERGPASPRQETQGGFRVHQAELRLRTRGELAFHDLTSEVRRAVVESGISEGICAVATRHTTTAVVVNENEPLLLDDMRRTLERAAPRDAVYEHDDFSRRAGPLDPDEPANGHAHCKALFLPASQSLPVTGGRLELGRWQSLFLVELDSSRDRVVSVTVMGV